MPVLHNFSVMLRTKRKVKSELIENKLKWKYVEEFHFTGKWNNEWWKLYEFEVSDDPA